MLKALDSEGQKRIEVEILDSVAEFCDKNGINYFLHYGTLIGAIRHKGFIPWDDDIDIGMLGPDYDKNSSGCSMPLTSVISFIALK